MSKKLGIHIGYFIYKQVYVGIRNPHIITETIKSHMCQIKNLHLVLQLVVIFEAYSLNTTLNTSKLVFVNTATV